MDSLMLLSNMNIVTRLILKEHGLLRQDTYSMYYRTGNSLDVPPSIYQNILP